MFKMSDFTFLSSNGVNNIHCRLWRPEKEVRGLVQIVHGVAEHIGRYSDFAEYLTEHGFAVVGDDHLGHGLSVNDNSELGWFAEENGWDKVVQDEKKLHDLMFENFPGVPMILLGHSMGSFIARTYIGRYPDDFNACIISGTGQNPAIVCRIGRMLANSEIKKHGSKYHSQRLQSIAFGSYLKGIENPIGPNDWICRDESVIRRYDADPLCGGTATAELMYEMMGGIMLIGTKAHMQKMNKAMPVLFISGDADPVGNWGKGVRTVYSRFKDVGMQDVTLKLYPGGRHEMLNELNKQDVWNDVLSWLEEKSGLSAE